MRHPQGLRGLALPAPLRRCGSHGAAPAAPGGGGSRDLRGWRPAGRRDGDAGSRSLPPTRTASPQCPPPPPPPSPRDAGAKVPGEPQPARGPGGRPEAAAGRRTRGGEARRDLSSEQGGVEVERGVRWLPEPLPGRPHPRPGHLPRSTSAPRRRRARGAARAAGAAGLPDRERDKPFAKPRVRRREESAGRRGGRRRRRSALPAPSRRSAPSSPPPPRPAGSGCRSVWRARRLRRTRQLVLRCRSWRVHAETPESPPLPPPPAAPPPPVGWGQGGEGGRGRSDTY